MDKNIVLHCADVMSGYQETAVIRNLYLDLYESEIVSIIGRNGVGKTTLLKTLFGNIPLLGGQIIFKDRDVSACSDIKRQKYGMAWSAQDTNVFSSLTVGDNLDIGTQYQGVKQVFFDTFPRIKERWEVEAGVLSGGERKILSFIRTLNQSAKLFMFDEPSEGVQQENIERISELLKQHICDNPTHTILVAEQNVTMAMAISTRILVMDHGKIIKQWDKSCFDKHHILKYIEI